MKGLDSGLAGLITALCILMLPKIRSRSIIWVGTVSYSLYLLHIPFGSRVVLLADRMEVPNVALVRVLVMVAALLVSLVAASIFFNIVEKPSHAFARKIGAKARN